MQVRPGSVLCAAFKVFQLPSPSPIPMAISNSLEGTSSWLWCPGIVVVSKVFRNIGVFLLGKQAL